VTPPGVSPAPIDERPAAPRGRDPAPAEIAAFLLIAALGLALRLVYVFHYPFNSDEPQHLHVAWAWTQGLVQYRDIFDNHTPLFHMLSAPVVAFLRESPDVLYAMRLAMIPLFLTGLWATYALGRIVFSPRVGLWAALLAGLEPVFFFESLEYRTDVLWMALWFLMLVVLLGGAWTRRRSLAAGLVLGLALCVSLKSVLLVAALAGAALGMPFVLARGAGAREVLAEALASLAPRAIGSRLALFVAGAVAPPFALTLLFASLGALRPFVYGTVLHNCLPGLGGWSRSWRALDFALIWVLTVMGVRALVRRLRPDARREGLAFLALLASLYCAALYLLWPIFTRQDMLPWYPLILILFTGGVDRAWRALAGPRGGVPGRAVARGSAWVLAPMALFEIGLLVHGESLHHDRTGPQRQLIAEVLRLTDAGDYVLDLKGETVFRRRPMYYVFETITKLRMNGGWLPERIQEEVLAHGACVAVAEIDRWPLRTQRFLEQNYLVVGRVRVAGRFLTPSDPARPRDRLEFDVTIPARYAIVAEQGVVAGLLDGAPYDGPRLLPAGRHAFTVASGAGRLALVWAQAIERGFSPFTTND